jgi:4-amino-4-deoxy-L-arabinose transferase-like glycosyltransferase
VAFLLRLAWVLLGPSLPPRGDDQAYIALAESLVSGRGYVVHGLPLTHYMPGWPVLLALPWALGLGMRGGQLLLCLLSTLIVLETYLLARRLISARAAMVAAWCAALFPPLIWYSKVLLAEVPSAAVFGLWALAAVIYVQEGGGWRRVTMLGGLTGLLVLFRAEMIILVPVPFLARALAGGIPREVLRAGAAAALTLAVLSPWALYNAQRLGKPVLLTTAKGTALWIVSQQPVVTDFNSPEFKAAVARLEVPGNPPLTEARFEAEAKGLIKANPWPYLRGRLTNLPRFWMGSHTEVVPGGESTVGAAWHSRDLGALALKLLGFGSQALLVVLTAAGLLMYARGRTLLLPWLIIGAKVAAHAPFIQAARFSLHLAPLLLCFAGGSLAWCLDRIWRTRRQPVRAGVTLAASSATPGDSIR